MLAHDTFERLPEIGSPTLILAGSDDQIIPAASSEPLAERIPDAELRVIDGTGHLFFVERAEETVGAVEDFLGR